MGPKKLSFCCVALVLIAAPLCAQTTAADAYLKSANEVGFFSNAERAVRKDKSEQELQFAFREMLPLSHPKALFDFVTAKGGSAQGSQDAARLAADAVAGQFNKLLGSSVGSSGTTSLTSGSAVSQVLSLAMEYGAITQRNSGSVATLRTNLFALTRPLAGDAAFPVCTDSSLSNACSPTARWLRKFSASYSAEVSGTGTATATATNGQTGVTNATDIFSGGYRTAAWSTRVDWFATNAYRIAQDKFDDAMKNIGNSVEMKALETSVLQFFDKPAVSALYNQWADETIAELKAVNEENDGKRRLDADLDNLINQLRKADSDFDSNVNKLQTAYQNYYDLLDNTIRELQTNKLSTEFTSRHPLGQANTSNLRMIYSWQPTKTPLLFTFNGAVTWYNTIPGDVTAVKVGKIRDAQLSAQLDRKIRVLGPIQNSVFTMAGYYQWQIQNALITINDGMVAPGTTIALPSAVLLASKGNIAVAQLKWTLPIKNGIVKIPFSFTWANRTELTNANEKRGQVGLVLDLDSVFAKGSR